MNTCSSFLKAPAALKLAHPGRGFEEVKDIIHIPWLSECSKWELHRFSFNTTILCEEILNRFALKCRVFCFKSAGYQRVSVEAGAFKWIFTWPQGWDSLPGAWPLSLAFKYRLFQSSFTVI